MDHEGCFGRVATVPSYGHRHLQNSVVYFREHVMMLLLICWSEIARHVCEMDYFGLCVTIRVRNNVCESLCVCVRHHRLSVWAGSCACGEMSASCRLCMCVCVCVCVCECLRVLVDLPGSSVSARVYVLVCCLRFFGCSGAFWCVCALS